MFAPPPASSGHLRTAHAAWIAPAITALVIGSAFIALYVGLQRAPVPLHLPVAVVGQPLAAAARAGLGDKVEVTEVPSTDQGLELVRDGRVVGVVAATSPSTLRLSYAGAQGLSQSSAARQLVAGIAAGTGSSVEEVDVVPLVRYDSRGLSGFYVVFGVTLASFVLAQGLSGAMARVRLRARLATMGGFAIVIGVVAATLAGPVYGSLPTPFPQLALVLVLLSAASALATKALGTWLGPAGIGLAVLLLTTFGNATSGATIGFDLLPAWAQAISPALPQGAAFRAVTDLGYFRGSHAAPSLLVLAAWFLVGLALVLLRHRLTNRRPAVPGDDTSSATSVARAD